MYSVKLRDLVKEYNLKNLTIDVDFSEKILQHPEVNRPALQFTGFFEYFPFERIQVVGLVEHTYINSLSKDKKDIIFKKICSYKVPCIILCRDLEPHEELLKYAVSYKVPIFQTKDTTSDFVSDVIRWLRVQLAPRVTIHGVLVDIYGEGVLITGESGIGKSETALELIKRGHRLVADDAVEIKKVSQNTLVGSCPEVIRYFIELRGIGIINVKKMFGVQSVKDTQGIDLIIKLEAWEKGKQYERLGLNEEYMEILGNNVVCQTLPVRPGRNLAMICESAAVNRRQKKMGYNATEALNERIIKSMDILD